MPAKRIELIAHHSLGELEAGYRGSADPIERSHWHIVWLYKQHRKAEVVAGMVAYSPGWVRAVVKRYNELGEEGLKDLRHDNPGNARILNEQQEAALVEALAKEAEGLGLWTGPKVAAWMSKKIKRKVSKVTGWSYLVRLGYSLQVPRPHHRDGASPQEREGFKKSSVGS
jgi:transposase